MLLCPGPKYAGASVALVDGADVDSHGTTTSAKSSHVYSMEGVLSKEIALRDGQHGVCVTLTLILVFYPASRSHILYTESMCFSFCLELFECMASTLATWLSPINGLY